MKLFIELEQVLRQPHRWASLLSGDTPQRRPGREAEAMLVQNYLARHFSAVKKLVIQRRKAIDMRGRERFVLRPCISAESGGAGRTWLGFVCEYDVAKRALKVVDRIALQPAGVLPNERVFSGDIALESRAFASAYCDSEAVAFFKTLPEPAEAEAAPTDRWRAYLEWRKKLANTRANETHAFRSWEKRPGNVIRFTLLNPLPQNQLRQRFQDEELRTGRDPRSPQGVFRRLATVLNAGSERQLAVDVEFDALAYDTFSLPPHGDLRVAMEGELSTLDIQLEGLRRYAEKQAQNPYLADWLFDLSKARPITMPECQEWTPLLTLNPEQREAVSRALAFDDLLLLWGPPGTGKTTVIAEICAQYARRGQRVLVASQANLAVEQALGRLPQVHLARAAWVSTARRREGVAGDLFGGLSRWLAAAGKAAQRQQACRPSGEYPWNEYISGWSDRVAGVQAGEFTPEDEARYLRRANVIGATCNECGKPDFVGSQRFSALFDLVIVDEVSKASPPELLLAMLMGRRVLLVGDHRQLPPLFKDEAFEDAIENHEIGRAEVEQFRDLVTASWFERAFREVPPSVRVGLQRQYRMHPRIMEAVNVFYADQPLRAGDDEQALAREKQHPFMLRGLDRHTWLKPGHSLVWIDTGHGAEADGAGEERVGTSRRNPLEAELAAQLVGQLADTCVKTGLSLGVISFYRAQTELIRDNTRRRKLPEGWLHTWRDINTVDQFQGSERDVIIVSLVRSGARLTGEFTRDFRRINVAFSRARKLLIVLGCRETFARAQVCVPSASGGEQEARVYESIQNMIMRHGCAFHQADILRREAAR